MSAIPPFNMEFVEDVARSARVSTTAVQAYAISSRPGHKLEELPDTSLASLLSNVSTSFFTFTDIPEGMNAAMVRTLREKYPRLSPQEVISAFGFASNGDLPDVVLNQSLNPQLLSKVLATYTHTQRAAILQAKAKVLHEKKSREEFERDMDIAEGNISRCAPRPEDDRRRRKEISRYAAEGPKGCWDPKFWWIEDLEPFVKSGQMQDLPEEYKTALRQKAVGEARVAELEFRKTEVQLGKMVSLNDVQKIGAEDIERQFQRLYAIALIEKNRTFVASLWK
jgi:hypothetical protein